MTTTSRSEGSILSPYGEGYCRHCRFVVGLNGNGLMVRHTRGANLDRYAAPDPCKGSDRRPAKRTPYASKKSRFHYKAPVAVCGCGSEVKLVRQYSDRFTYSRHTRPGLLGGLCPRSFERVPD